MHGSTEPVITVMPSASDAARQVLRAYFAEVASRYYGTYSHRRGGGGGHAGGAER